MKGGFMDYWKNNKKLKESKYEVDEELEDEDIDDEVDDDDDYEDEEEDNEEQPGPIMRKRPSSDSLTDQINALKDTLYKKIDICFMKYGLNGLKRIDAAIANGLTEYIEKPDYRRPDYVRRAERKSFSAENMNRVKEQQVSNAPVRRKEYDTNDDFIEEAAEIYEQSCNTSSSSNVKISPLDTKADKTVIDSPESIEEQNLDENVTDIQGQNLDNAKPVDSSEIDLNDVGNILD